MTAEEYLNSDSISDLFGNSISKSLGGGLSGDTAGMLGGTALYFIPYVGSALALDDARSQIVKMWRNRGNNTLGDWGNLALIGAYALPVIGGAAKLISKGSKVAKGANALHLTLLGGKTIKKQVGKSVAGLGTVAGLNLVSPATADLKRYNHYGKMMTAEEIKKDNILRMYKAKTLALKVANQKAKQILLKQQLTLQNITLESLPQILYQMYKNYNIPYILN